MAILDVRKPKAPLLKLANALQYPRHTESLGDSAFLMANEQQMDAAAVTRDYQVVDTSDPADPALLCTIKQVNSKNCTRRNGNNLPAWLRRVDHHSMPASEREVQDRPIVHQLAASASHLRFTDHRNLVAAEQQAKNLYDAAPGRYQVAVVVRNGPHEIAAVIEVTRQSLPGLPRLSGDVLYECAQVI
jgi:hypothetical protein